MHSCADIISSPTITSSVSTNIGSLVVGQAYTVSAQYFLSLGNSGTLTCSIGSTTLFSGSTVGSEWQTLISPYVADADTEQISCVWVAGGSSTYTIELTAVSIVVQC